MSPALRPLSLLVFGGFLSSCSKAPHLVQASVGPPQAVPAAVAETPPAGNSVYIGVSGPAGDHNIAQRKGLGADAVSTAQLMLGLAYGADVVFDGDNIRLNTKGFSTRGSSTRDMRELPDGSVLVHVEAPMPPAPQAGQLGMVSLLVPVVHPAVRKLSFASRFQRELGAKLKLLMKKHQVSTCRVHLRSMALVNPEAPEAVRIELLVVKVAGHLAAPRR